MIAKREAPRSMIAKSEAPRSVMTQPAPRSTGGALREDGSARPADVAPPVTEREEQDALERAALHLRGLQRADGTWEGEMVWCTMILSQYIIVQRLVGHAIPAADREQMLRHYRVTQRRDGSWGLHGESGGYVFTTVLAYVALRLLDVPADDPLTKPARRWLHAQPGGVLSVPTWGKFWLALLDLYSYDGVNPFPPELFDMPEWLPQRLSDRVSFRIEHLYCHTRYIYLGVAYLYGRRFSRHLGRVTDQLRFELYSAPYSQIDFAAHRHDIAETDLYVRPGRALRAGYELLRLHERVHSGARRERALERCLERIVYEQRASRYQALSPVNGLLNCLALFSAYGPGHPDFLRSLDGVQSWRWEDQAEGLRFVGAHSTSWDTAFALQALLSRRLPGETLSAADTAAVRAGYQALQRMQMTDELPDHEAQGRDPILGGWCFSDGAHRWPVSDCTAEALVAIFQAHGAPGLIPVSERIPVARLIRGLEFLLSRQNADGGFGTYERRRGFALLERLNPSEMYGQCMTERSYLECTASAVRALSQALEAPVLWPAELRSRCTHAVRRAVKVLRRAQRADGGFPGFWGINYTYGAFHVVKALRAAGAAPSDPALTAAAAWLIGAQRPDGAWGEHYTGCLTETYVPHPDGQAVMTAWAVLALQEILPDSGAVRRGVSWLRQQQQADGGFPQGGQNGVFFGTAMLDYRLYKSYFPLWALGRHRNLTRL